MRSATDRLPAWRSTRGASAPALSGSAASGRDRRALIVSLVALAILPVACASLPPANLRPPEISIADLTPVDFGLDRLRLRVVLDTENPNDVLVPLTDIRMNLTVFGVELAQGYVIDRRVELPPRGRVAVPVEFTVPMGRLLDLFERFRHRNWDQFDYRLAGTANWGNTPFSVPFERTGNLEVLKRLPGLLGTR